MLDIDLISCESIASFKTLLKTNLFIIAYIYIYDYLIKRILCYLIYHEHILPFYLYLISDHVNIKTFVNYHLKSV